MASFIDGLIEKLSNRVADDVVGRMAVEPILTARAYNKGFYQPQLKVMGHQFNDNIGLNLSGLLVNRVVSQMLGNGFTLDFEGDTETPQEEYVNAVFDANHQEVLFHRGAVKAAEAGTGFILIIPAGIVGEDGNTYPRLQVVNPELVLVETQPEDYEVVIRYTVTYKYTEDGEEKARRRVYAHDGEAGTWTITDYISQRATGTKWVQVSEDVWPYDFAPIIHWQNNPGDILGIPDLTPAQIELQDRYNFIASNISKVIRYFGHPQRYARKLGTASKVQLAPDEMPNFTDEAGGIFQLEALGDLASSLQFLNIIRQTFFACGRVVDIDSLTDKLGSLTNFGLRVLYQDNLNMIATKRELFGDMIEELSRRLQIINGMEPVLCEVVWPDFLPVNEAEQQAAITADLANGLLSVDTARQERGYDNEKETERMANDITNPAFWSGAKAAVDAGVSLEGYLRTMGMEQSMINSLLYDGVPEQ